MSGENFKLHIVERVVYFIPLTLKAREAVSAFMLLHIGNIYSTTLSMRLLSVQVCSVRLTVTFDRILN